MINFKVNNFIPLNEPLISFLHSKNFVKTLNRIKIFYRLHYSTKKKIVKTPHNRYWIFIHFLFCKNFVKTKKASIVYLLSEKKSWKCQIIHWVFYFFFFFFALHFCMSSISSNFLSSEKIRENKECAAADLLLSCLDFTQKKFKCCFSLSICSLSEIYSLKIIPWNRFHEIFVKESRKDNSSGIPPYRLLIVLWFHEKKLHSFFSFSKNFVKTFIPFFVFQKFRENTLCSLKVDNTDK